MILLKHGELTLWHYSHVFSSFDSRESAGSSSPWGVMVDNKRSFFWIDKDLGLFKSFPSPDYSIKRFQTVGHGDYVGQASFRTTCDLVLCDLMDDGMKEFYVALFHETSCYSPQDRMIATLQNMGFDGWMSWHNRGDAAIEICLFRPIDCIEEISRVIIGP
jgi:hypothetical protein